MMADDRLDLLLRRVRPVGPAPGLRRRILGMRREPPAWPWAAAAALLMATLVLACISAGDLHRDLRAAASMPADPDERAYLEELRQTFALADDHIRLIAIRQELGMMHEWIAREQGRR